MQLQELKSLLVQLADVKSKLEEAKKGTDWSAEADSIEKKLESSAEPSDHIGAALDLARNCINSHFSQGTDDHRVRHHDVNQIEKIYDHAEMHGDYDRMHDIAKLPLHYVRGIIRSKRMMN